MSQLISIITRKCISCDHRHLFDDLPVIAELRWLQGLVSASMSMCGTWDKVARSNKGLKRGILYHFNVDVILIGNLSPRIERE